MKPLLLILATIIAAASVAAWAVSLTSPQLAPTESGTIDRTHKSDRAKAPPRALRVVGECRSS
ncbi:hypothetical protein [Hansschlegelia sp.]|uniref:hypothetical protein n=1 Tax=Hansschlegelia sp. TaxID=2041892 RepID=UPI002B679519|nr:hypothetical protein [Hansschlegelia sp.]HVI27490.1 hypothetical protein [Hansschlegelia sp.]